MPRLFPNNKRAINLTRHRTIKDRIAVSVRWYKTKLIQDLERTKERLADLEMLIACAEKDINHWNYWDRQKRELRAVMEKIQIIKKNK